MYAKKVVHVKPPRYLKVSLSAIYQTRADNDRYEHTSWRSQICWGSLNAWKLRKRLLWAVLRPQGGPRQPQDSPREPKRARDSPQGTRRGPRGRQWASQRQLLETLKRGLRLPKPQFYWGKTIGSGNVCFCLPNHHKKFTYKNPLNSSSKMHTTLAPEPQNGVTKGKNPCWAHVGLYDTRWSTCEKLSFIEVKR